MDVLLSIRVEPKDEGALPAPEEVRTCADDHLADITKHDFEYPWRVVRVTLPEHHAGDRALLDELARYTGHIEDMDPMYRLWMLGALHGALSRLLGWPDAAEQAVLTREVPGIVRQLRELANELEDAGAEERPALLRQAASELDRRQ